MSLPENPQRPVWPRALLADDVLHVAQQSAAGEDLAGSTILTCCRFVIEYFLGREWFRLFVPPDCKYHGYLTMRPVMRDAEVGQDPRHMVKMINFAEMLLNLQHTPGFDCLLDKLLGGEIEPTVAELSAGMAFALHRHHFEFVKPSGAKGADYDIRVVEAGAGVRLAADVKCKLDDSEYVAQTIWNAFKKAKSQIPSDMPGMVIVRVPETWVDRQTGIIGVDAEVKGVVHQLFKSRRFVLVAFHTIMLWDRPEGMYIRHMAQEYENPSPQFERPGGWKHFEGEPDNPGWASLLAIMNHALEQAGR